MSMGADTKANTSGGGAREVGDLCLLEDGSEYSDALFFDAVASKTTSERQSDDVVRAVCVNGR